MGLDKVIIGGRLGTSGDANAARSLALLEQEVMPALRG